MVPVGETEVTVVVEGAGEGKTVSIGAVGRWGQGGQVVIAAGVAAMFEATPRRVIITTWNCILTESEWKAT